MTTATTSLDVAADSARIARQLQWKPKWRLYFIEAALLGMFMVSACFFVYLLEHPSSPVSNAVANAFVRRMLVGMAMGLIAISLIYSPLGKRSGALMNPAMTLSFLWLGRIDPRDAMAYIAAQFAGAAAGVAVMNLVVMDWVRDPHVHYVATVPGSPGLLAAWIAEFAISFVLVVAVMTINKTPRLARLTGCFAGLLVATYITFESPLSGMSMNPARTFGSALLGHIWTGFWIYLTAPVLGMLAATELHARLSAQPHRLCGKVNHSHHCVFKCHCLDPK